MRFHPHAALLCVYTELHCTDRMPEGVTQALVNFGNREPGTKALTPD